MPCLVLHAFGPAGFISRTLPRVRLMPRTAAVLDSTEGSYDTTGRTSGSSLSQRQRHWMSINRSSCARAEPISSRFFFCVHCAPPLFTLARAPGPFAYWPPASVLNRREFHALGVSACCQRTADADVCVFFLLRSSLVYTAHLCPYRLKT